MSTSPLELDPLVIDEVRGTTILDVGCGYGKWGFLVKKYFWSTTDGKPEIEPFVVGLDLFHNSLRRLRNHRIYDYVINGDALALPFPDKSFDTVFGMELIEHLPKEMGTHLLAELERVARRRVLISTPNHPDFRGGLDGIDGFNLYENHLSLWTPGEFKEMGYRCHGVGLKVGPRPVKMALRSLSYQIPWLATHLFGVKSLDAPAFISCPAVKTKQPLISIGLPVYNAEWHLEASLRSLLAQDYSNFEIIISDNHSTDATASICKRFAQLDNRIRFYQNEENLGMFKNFNKVFDLSRGDFFMWAGAHDLWARHFLRTCLETLHSYPEAVLCAGEYREIDERDKFLKVIPVYPDLHGLSPASRLRWVITDLGSCFCVYSLIRSDAIRRTKRFVDKFGADTVLVAELSQLGEFIQNRSAAVHIRAFSKRNFSTEENLIRLLGKNGKSHRRLAFSEEVKALLGVIRRAPISLDRKVPLYLRTVNQWKGSVSRELAVHYTPQPISRLLKRK